MLCGCALSPSARLDEEARSRGFQAHTLTGTEFAHRVYLSRPAREATGRLHVYLEGDGTPWLGPGRPAEDPTPREPLALRLMALDPAPALYLGRPCYMGLHRSLGCHPWHWTHGRYGEPVVASLAAVLERLLDDGTASELVLIGYSGGGALVMLLAERVPRVHTLVTVAGNLEVDRWARLHGYSPLRGSLNPADRSPLPPHVRQWHWLGDKDRDVPPDLVLPVVAREGSARVEVLENVDHRCCWEALWPQLLQAMGEI
jgi:pimeloyl-ACP methyl ester carboxylesterase